MEMKPIKIILTIAASLLLIINLKGQSPYILKDTSLSVNMKLIEGTDRENASFIQVKTQKNEIVKYKPQEIKEYGFENGRVYVSKEINIHNTIQNVFLERLVRGRVTLYFYKNGNGRTFYIEKDSSVLVPLNKTDSESNKQVFKKDLEELLKDCDNVKGAIKVSTYNKKSLALLVRDYNSCKMKPIPHFKFGLLVGFNTTKLYSSANTSDEYLRDAVFNIDKSFSIGAFCDIPLYLGNLYLHPEIYYLENAFLYNLKNTTGETDVVINNSSINLPILVRYNFPLGKLQPFVSMGVFYSKAIKNDNSIYQTRIRNNVVEIDMVNSSKILSENHAGYSIGLGSMFDINYHQSVLLELRYNKPYPVNSDLPLEKDILNLNIGFVF
jgi:hypothetical protein